MHQPDALIHLSILPMQVCGDRLLTSHDPSEARLLDGEIVLGWAQLKLEAIEAEVVAALKSEQQLRGYVTSGRMQRDLGRINLLLGVLGALNRIRGSAAFAQGGRHTGGGATTG